MASNRMWRRGISSRQAGHLRPIMRRAGADLPWSGSPSRADFRLSRVITSLIRGPHTGHNRA
jgi:hypothetical protein